MIVRWALLDVEVDIKEHSQHAVGEILNNKKFESQNAYEQFIVTVCVKNLEEVVPLIRAYLKQQASEGNHLRVAELNHELYLIVCEVNPLLRNEIEGGNSHMEIQKRPRGRPGGGGPDGRQRGDDCPHTCAASEPPQQEKSLDKLTKSDLLSIESDLREHIVGHDDAINSIGRAVRRGSVGLKDPNQPIAVFIFLGNTGIGKTYTAVKLNDTLIGDGSKSLIRIDCSEFAEGHEYTKLIGAPSGYRGFERGGILTNSVAAYPFSIVLADEIEEAHERTRKLFLQIMEDGRLTDGQGNQVNYNQTIVIMTTNIGTEKVKGYEDAMGFKNPDAPRITSRQKESTLRKALEKDLPAKFLNRVDEIIFFKDLTWDQYLEVSDLELKKLLHPLKTSRGITALYGQDLITWVRDGGVDPVYGARPIKRWLKNHIANPLTDLLLSGDVEDGTSIFLGVEKDKLVVEKDHYGEEKNRNRNCSDICPLEGPNSGADAGAGSTSSRGDEA